jgi:hypothetical protein
MTFVRRFSRDLETVTRLLTAVIHVPVVFHEASVTPSEILTPGGNEITTLPSFTLDEERVIFGRGYDDCVPGSELPCHGLP